MDVTLKLVITLSAIDASNVINRRRKCFQIFCEEKWQEKFPAAQWLRLHATTVGDVSSIPGWELKIPKPRMGPGKKWPKYNIAIFFWPSVSVKGSLKKSPKSYALFLPDVVGLRCWKALFPDVLHFKALTLKNFLVWLVLLYSLTQRLD